MDESRAKEHEFAGQETLFRPKLISNPADGPRQSDAAELGAEQDPRTELQPGEADPSSTSFVWGSLHELTQQRLSRGALNELIGHALEDDRQFLTDIEERFYRQDQLTAVRLCIIYVELRQYKGEIQKLADSTKVKIAHNTKTPEQAEIGALVRVYASYLSRSSFDATRVNRLCNEIQGILELSRLHSLQANAANSEQVWMLIRNRTQGELIGLVKGDSPKANKGPFTTSTEDTSRSEAVNTLRHELIGTCNGTGPIQAGPEPREESQSGSVQSLPASVQHTPVVSGQTVAAPVGAAPQQTASEMLDRPLVNKPADGLELIGEVELPALANDVEYVALIGKRTGSKFELYGPFAHGEEEMCHLRDAAFDLQLGEPEHA
ncbi:hypothetical protein [Devosia naphthalenivorans]|uniref:hypothetical protein n=1 Tax=Devosia naphthalenivorans TaxID=2082392 RepID=UPI000D3C4DDE|nr:hypothetical protein [Devosia naphthalenivorans]